MDLDDELARILSHYIGTIPWQIEARNKIREAFTVYLRDIDNDIQRKQE